MNANKVLVLAVTAALLAGTALAALPAVRIKDIATISDARENQLMGFGLVVGLRLSGDSQQTEFTKQAVTNLLSNMGLSSPTPVGSTTLNPVYNLSNVPKTKEFKTKNTASVMVTAMLPAFTKPGQKIDVTVSSIGDATSLKGGTLIATPLKGMDDKVYAVAQGAVSLGGATDISQAGYNPDVTTTGRIPGGAIVEKEIPVYLGEKLSATSDNPYMPDTYSFSILLNDPDFTTASRVAYTLAMEGIDAKAQDASSIVVSVPQGQDVIALVAKAENLTVVPDVRAKVVINERTGTIVIGENIKLGPVAVSYGRINVSIGGGENPQLKVTEKGSRLVSVRQGGTLRELVRSLNAIGASPKDMIAILQAIRSAGALTAEIEVM